MGNITDDNDCANLITNEGITEKVSIQINTDEYNKPDYISESEKDLPQMQKY
jgi:hypothetical protein